MPRSSSSSPHRRSSQRQRLLLALVALICLPAADGLGQTSGAVKFFDRYQQFVWSEEHGLPQSSVSAIVRTRDGYLWLGTQGGVARFDGVRFTVFDHSNTKGFKGSVIRSLLEDRAGNLWLGSDTGGLNLYRGGSFTHFTSQDGLSNDQISDLLEDREGAVWAGTYGGLARFKDGRFTLYTTRDGLPDLFVQVLAEDGAGNLWVGTRNGLARFKDGRFTVYTTREGLPDGVVRLLCRDQAGQLWVSTENGLRWFKDDRLTDAGLPDELADGRIQHLSRDREGNLWVAADGRRLFRRSGERWEQLVWPESLPGQRVHLIYQDPEGTLWISTESGLSQFRSPLFQVYSMPEGLSNDHVTAIYEDAAGKLWVGTAAGLNCIEGGKITVYAARDGLPPKPVYSIGEDLAGNLWVGSTGGVTRFKDGRFTTWTTQDGLTSNLIAAVLPDRAGNVWVGTYGAGLNLFRDGRFTAYTTRDGLASDYVKTLSEDRAGNILVGTKEGGISRVRDGRITTLINQDGRATKFIASFYEDRRGALWIGTLDDGLSRLKDGKFAQITVRDGLYDNMVFQILSDTDDDSGNLWMNCNRGIFRVSLKDLNDFADGRIKSVASFAYGVADGMISRENNAASPAGWRTRDGRLWFPTTRGVVSIDPRRLNSQPPQLSIEGVMVAHAPAATDQVVELRPGQGDLEIQYTALSWNRPQQIRFKYQLVGLDADWIEAGTRRTAYYPYLPPGSYTFKVIADNGEGIWNTEGKSLRVVMLPPFYRTWWFLTLAALSVATFVTLTFQLRVRQLQRARAAQQEFSRRLIESQEHERKRIAAELHDSLSQSLVIIKNRAELSLSTPEDPDRAFEQLEEIADAATGAIVEVKEISYALRPYQLDRLGLQKALISMIKKVGETHGLPIAAEIEPLDGLFSAEGEINLYRIIQESVNNIVRHAGASAASVNIRRHAERVLVRIEDDGRGFIVGQSNGYEPGQGGFGLLGLVERARILGAQPVIQSAPGQGTTITLEIPLSTVKP